MWNRKLKAITFSYDDGVTQDIRLTQLFHKYGLKATFHLNNPGFEKYFPHFLTDPKFVSPDEYKELYRGHEVSCHGEQHSFMFYTPDEYIRREVRENKRFLENIMMNI